MLQLPNNHNQILFFPFLAIITDCKAKCKGSSDDISPNKETECTIKCTNTNGTFCLKPHSFITIVLYFVFTLLTK